MLRVYIADDQPEVRSALRLLLEQEVWIDVVGEAAEADTLLAEAAILRPDVVLLDWELPGAGVDLLQAIKAKTKQTFVVAMSGRSEAKRASLAAGAKAFVSKGEHPERLLRVLDALLLEPVGETYHRPVQCKGVAKQRPE